MFISSSRLESGIAGLDTYTLATSPTSLLQAKTYIVCNVGKTRNWYGLWRFQRVRHQALIREDLQPLSESGS